MNVTVGTLDMRRALIAVGPHADPDKDFPQLHRVRVDVAGEVTVSATNRYTVGLALVPVVDSDGEVDAFDLSPSDVSEILTVFPCRSKDDEAFDATLRFEVTSEHVTVTDISGLFPGKALVLPRYATEENFPRLEQVIAAKLTAKLSGRAEAADRLITSGQLLGLFGKAVKAYGQPLVIDPGGEAGAMLLTCGEAFVGLLMPQRPDESTTAQITGWHAAWLQRFQDRAPELTP